MSEKYFSRNEANDLLPLIGVSLVEARRKKQLLDKLRGEIVEAASRIMALGGSVPPLEELTRKKASSETLTEELTQAVNEIQQTGCVVKDLDVGLVDFPSLRRGEEIYLCWKLGEERVAYWHGVDEGFAGRKPLDDPERKESPPRLPPTVQ
ncbi:MAG: DUF2203 domain-containing protein [Acidobacteriia bacterium]|nr:DUF2203 domain-containing protein [Terriglobia bacterium]